MHTDMKKKRKRDKEKNSLKREIREHSTHIRWWLRTRCVHVDEKGLFGDEKSNLTIC